MRGGWGDGAFKRHRRCLDGRGDVVALTDRTGAVVDRYYYDAWGTPVSPDGLASPFAEAVHQPLRYRGYWYDGWDDSRGPGRDQGWNTSAALSWYWLPARPYDPALRRFLQPNSSSRGE